MYKVQCEPLSHTYISRSESDTCFSYSFVLQHLLRGNELDVLARKDWVAEVFATRSPHRCPPSHLWCLLVLNPVLWPWSKRRHLEVWETTSCIHSLLAKSCNFLQNGSMPEIRSQPCWLDSLPFGPRRSCPLLWSRARQRINEVESWDQSQQCDR